MTNPFDGQQAPSELLSVEHDTVVFQVCQGVPGFTVWLAWETPDTYDGTFFTLDQWHTLRTLIDNAFGDK